MSPLRTPVPTEGDLAARVDALATLVRDQGERVEGLQRDRDRGAAIAGAVQWGIGVLLSALLALGAWQVRTTIQLEERQTAAMELLRAHQESPGHEHLREAISELATVTAAMRTTQERTVRTLDALALRVAALEANRRGRR